MKDVNINKIDNVDKMHKTHDKYCNELLTFVDMLRAAKELQETEDEFKLGKLSISDKAESVLHSLEMTPLVLKKKIK